MEIQALKIFNYIKLILFLILVLGVITVLTACGDLVKESDAGACNSAIDARNYGEALSVCTSRKDIASAYMGLAGYDIINLLKSSGTTTSSYTDPTGGNLGTDDVTGASILNILQLSVAIIADNDTRATAISNSKTNLDSAYELLQPSLGDNSSSPLTTDEILLNTFAISFAMQLNQIIVFDNRTTSTTVYPTGNNVNNLTCTEATGAGGALASAKLIAMDGHIWATEMNGMQCERIKSAIKRLPSGEQAAAVTKLILWVSNGMGAGGPLPSEFQEIVCAPFSSLKKYLTDLAANIAKLSLSGDSTKAITNAQTSTKVLMTAVGCPTS